MPTKKLANIACRHTYLFIWSPAWTVKREFSRVSNLWTFYKHREQRPLLQSLFRGCSCNQQPYIQNLPLNGTAGMRTVQEERSRTPHSEFLSSDRTHCTGHSTWPSSHCSVGTGALGADTRIRWYTATATTATTFRSSAIIREIVAAKFLGSKEDKISDLSQPLTWTGHYGRYWEDRGIKVKTLTSKDLTSPLTNAITTYPLGTHHLIYTSYKTWDCPVQPLSGYCLWKWKIIFLVYSAANY